MVQDVEGLSSKLQIQPLGKPEDFEDRYVGRPIAWPKKSVTSEIAHASQEWCGEEIWLEIEAVGPLLVSCMDVISNSVETVILYPVQVVVSSYAYALTWIKGADYTSAGCKLVEAL